MKQGDSQKIEQWKEIRLNKISQPQSEESFRSEGASLQIKQLSASNGSDMTTVCRRKNLRQSCQINEMFPSSHCWRYDFSLLNYPRNSHSLQGRDPTALHFTIGCHIHSSYIQLTSLGQNRDECSLFFIRFI